MAPNTASIRMGSTESTGKQVGSQPFKRGIELKTACGATARPVRAETADGHKECGPEPKRMECGDYRDRTDDLLNANQMLSQLSYDPTIRFWA